jgi:putative intracellular protease/amidase/YHS domain-containing protein
MRLIKPRRLVRPTALLLLLLLVTPALPAQAPPSASAPSAPSAPPLALRGLDPVSVIERHPQPGEERFSSTHGRLRYQFASAANKATFEADPERWALQLDGHCALMPAVATDGAIHAVHDGRLYALGSAGCKSEFLSDPARYLAAARARVQVAIVLFEGVQIIDYTGPYEVLGQAGFGVYTVAKTNAPLTTSMGMRVTPDFSFADAPPADLLVIPGGGVESIQEDPAAIDWLRARATAARHVLTVCNGAFLLARTGLLDGLEATTFYGLIPELREAAPRTRVVTDRRYVDNGKIVTTAGLSSGIDGALHMIEKLRGQGAAQQVALNMEYDWRPDSGYARASLADAELRRLFGRSLRLEVPGGGTARVLRTQGTADRWEASWAIASATPLAGLQAGLVRHLTEVGQWTPSESPAAAGPDAAGAPRAWRFVDAEQRSWEAEVELVPAAAPGEAGLTIRLERAPARSASSTSRR